MELDKMGDEELVINFEKSAKTGFLLNQNNAIYVELIRRLNRGERAIEAIKQHKIVCRGWHCDKDYLAEFPPFLGDGQEEEKEAAK
jgi:hypothetical protein